MPATHAPHSSPTRFPAVVGLDAATLSPPAARWNTDLREYVLDWDDVCGESDPRRAAIDFGLSAVRHACQVCGWDPDLAASAEGSPPPVT